MACAQLYLPAPPPRDPAEYGRVILDEHAASSPGGVVFDHWLHRSKFTCRLCHVDIGFAMTAKGTGITAEANGRGYQCGACHDGKHTIDGKVVFAACTPGSVTPGCSRCHSLGKTGVRHYTYTSYTAALPKYYVYGIDWVAAESSHKVHPVDFLEGVSSAKPAMHSRADFTIPAKLDWVHPIYFSHESHALWNGCELCHPEIFPTAKRDTVHFSMFLNIEHRYCGACHGSVASPLNNCSKCHPKGPAWAP